MVGVGLVLGLVAVCAILSSLGGDGTPARDHIARLHIDGREFESWIRLIQSRFEISVCEILRTPAG